MRLHVGCAMWTHPVWPGRQLPTGLPPRERLRAYASWCNAVEGNTTFYATPSRDTVTSWADQTDPEFRFVLKLPKPITHERRLVDVAQPVSAFLAAVQPLGERLHALWIQLPASFGPGEVGRLDRFLRGLPSEHRYAVEVRHPAFFTDRDRAAQFAGVLRESGAEWVTFDTTVLYVTPPTSPAELEAAQKKPRLPRRMPALTDHPIVRYIGRDSVEETVRGWQPWVAKVVTWLTEGRSPTVFLHTPDNNDALLLARRFHADVRTHLPALPPLPTPIPTEPMTLF